MDPNATLFEWACAVLSEDRERANEAYENLRMWLERGGFEPEWGNTRISAPSRKQFFSYNPSTGHLE